MDEQPPRPVAIWVAGTFAYAILVLALGLVLSGVDPDSAVFPPLLTALAGLFVATAINVRAPYGEEVQEWNRFQTHVIVVTISSMVLGIGLVMCALAFPGELIQRLAFWGAAIAILIGATFLLATVWERLSTEEPGTGQPEVSAPEPEPEVTPETQPEPEAKPEPQPEPEAKPEPQPEAEPKSELRRSPQTDLVAETMKKAKKAKKSGKKKSKGKDSKKKK